jgi:hypothetical protein
MRAATGWLELGDHLSAFEELERLPQEKRAHPDVLKIRYEIYAKAGRWESAFELAEGLSRLVPDDVGLTADPCATSPPHPSRQRAHHCTVCS